MQLLCKFMAFLRVYVIVRVPLICSGHNELFCYGRNENETKA